MALWALAASSPGSAQGIGSDDPGDFIVQAQELARQGNREAALKMYRNALQITPDSFQANLGAGVEFDLAGDYTTARKYFAHAIATSSGADRVHALRNMAISYGFERDCRGAEPYGKQAYEAGLAAKDFYNAGEAAAELAGLCLESGDSDAALRWYKTGYEAGLREPDIKPDRKDLWEFRWQHAQARIAARRGDKAEAQAHAKSAEAILAKGTNPRQEQFLPYLLGYIAFYAGDYETALEQLLKADQNDAFIAALTAQTYEKLGRSPQAMDSYRRAYAFTEHNPPVAYARPLARQKLRQ